MTDISISAIKGGYRELFQSTPNAPSGMASAMRPDSGSPFSVGREVFAISYSNAGIICTKCKIIRDVLGGSRVGNIAISLLIPWESKTSGNEIVTLLNELLEQYCKKYVDSDHNLGDVYEDWRFIDEILKKYDLNFRKNLENSIESISPGTAESAFIYYSSEKEVENYFDALYQEEYLPFRHILLVESEMQGKAENPLNALRHDPTQNLTGKIDLENPTYELKEFHEKGKSGITIEIWANDTRKYGKGRIKRKDNLKIRYSKNYFEPIEVSGKLSDGDSEIHKYLTVEGKKILIENDVELAKKSKEILLEAKDKSGKEMLGAKFICNNTYLHTTKEVEGNKIRFEGEELKDSWSISAQTENFKSPQSVVITPERSNTNIILRLEEFKIVKFLIEDNGAEVPNARVEISDKSLKSSKNEIEFIGEQLNRNYSITVSHKGYKEERLNYHPVKDGNPKVIKLTPKTSLSNPTSPTTNNPPPAPDVTSAESSSTQKKFIFLDKPAHIALGVICMIVVGIIAWFTTSNPPTPGTTQAKNEITAYVEGTELFEEKLRKYKIIYCPEKSLLQKIFPFTSNSGEYADLCLKIQTALNIRLAINEGNIQLLKSESYSPKQNKFWHDIIGVERKFEEKIGQIMHDVDVSKTNLIEIGKFINNLQKLLEIREVVQTSTNKETLEKQRTEVDKITSNVFDIESIKSDIKKEIYEKLLKNESRASENTLGHNDSISKDKPSKPKKEIDKPSKLLPDARAFEKEFWALIHSKEPNIDNFAKWAEKYPYNADNKEYKKVYDELLNNDDKVNGFARIPIIDRKKVKSLSELKDLIDKNKQK